MDTVAHLLHHFTPEHYALSLTIDRVDRTFHGTVHIKGLTTDSDIRLHAKDLTISTISLNETSCDFAHTENDTLLIHTPDEFMKSTVDIAIDFSGSITDAMHGMYPCHFQVDGSPKELLATQFESRHAREVFPCIDEPGAKAVFDVTLRTESGVTVLGNMPVISQTTSDTDEYMTTTFAPTPRMSSYLLAWVIGDLHKKTATTDGGVEVNVWATHAQPAESLDFALDHAVKSIDFFNDYFGIDYPLPKSDHVALPDFSSGAMENWGLITYREIALLADPKTTTVASRQYIATVISHELSHQWFGNLVTMKWWNNLWLNESFATLMEYIAVDAIHPTWNAWLDFATQESILALRRDAIDGVQPVQVEVHHPDEIASLFDGAIVYAKGARLMRMCQEYIGHEAFRRGLQSYFKEFAYKNTEADDLWCHLSQASGKDISSMMNVWISQSGYPVVHVTSDGIRQNQFFIGPHTDSTKLWPIPLSPESIEDVPAMLETRELLTPIADDERLNIRDAGHFITHYSDDHLARILDGLDTYDEIGRLQLLHEQTLLARGSVIPSARLIDILGAYAQETRDSVWDIIALAFGELKKFVEIDERAEQALRSFARKLAADQFERLGWARQNTESDEDTKLRSTILGLMVYSEDSSVLTKIDATYSIGIETIDPEIRSLVLSSVVRRTTSLELIHELVEHYRTSASADIREDICAGLTSVRNPEQIDYILNLFTDKDTIRPQDLFRWFAYMMRNRYARDATWNWLVAHWDWVVETYAGDKSYDDFARYSAAALMTNQQLEAYRSFFEPKLNIPALTRTIELGIREVEGRIELLHRDGDAVRERLLDAQ